jgi:hypothetical protein
MVNVAMDPIDAAFSMASSTACWQHDGMDLVSIGGSEMVTRSNAVGETK